MILFSFFKFYYYLFTKNIKRFDIACANDARLVMALTTPFSMFLFWFFLSLTFSIPNSIVIIGMSIFSLLTILNFAVINTVSKEGFKIRDKIERIKREMEAEELKRKIKEERIRREKEEKRRRAELDEEIKRIIEEAIERAERINRIYGNQKQKNQQSYNNYNKYYNQSSNHTAVDQNRINAMKLMSLKEGFTQDDLKSRYKELVKVHHPDRGGLEANFIKLNKAYNYLKNKE